MAGAVSSAEGDGLGAPLLPFEEKERSRLRRRLSAYEIDGINAALDTVNQEGNRMQEAEGLSQGSFFLGVLNVPLLCLVLAWWPEHFWVLYCLECMVLIPAWLITVHRVYNGVLFVLDFCWVINICFTLYMFLGLWGPWDESHRLGTFLSFFSVSLGPLSWACIALHNGLVFHSIEKTASLTIHLVPLFVAWTVVQFNDRVQAAWPGRFPTTEQLAFAPISDLYVRGLAVYLLWWVLHSAWLLTVGIEQPAKGHDTVFGNLYEKRGLGPKFEKLAGCVRLRSHAALYLVIHLLLCMLAFTWPMLCFWSPATHVAFGVVVFASAAWSGAGYYEYIMAHRYAKAVRQLLEERERRRQFRGGDTTMEP